MKKPAPKKTAPKKPVKKTSSQSKPAPRTSAAFKPLDDRLIVQVEAAAEKTAGGIIIPGTAGERPFRGKVLAKGPGRRNKKGLLRPLDVNVGDMVLFPQYAGQKIEIGAEEFLILREEEVLAISIA
jgi:chaperonin GroES